MKIIENNDKWMYYMAVSYSISLGLLFYTWSIEVNALRIVLLILSILLVSIAFVFCIKMRQCNIGTNSSFKENAVILLKFISLVICVIILMGLFMGLTAVVMQKILPNKSVGFIMGIINMIACIIYILVYPIIVNAFWLVVTENDSFLEKFKEKLTIKRYIQWLAVGLGGMIIGLVFLLIPFVGLVRFVLSLVLSCVMGIVIIDITKRIYIS